MKIGIISGSSLRHTALASFFEQRFEIIQFSEIVRKKITYKTKEFKSILKELI